MKSSIKLLLVLILLFALAPDSLAADAKAARETLCVMTYNVRFATPKPPNEWPKRRPLIREVITQVAPDLIGTQEGVYYQLREMAADLPEYEWIGLGREGGSRGEFMAVYFRKDRFEPIEFDHFWLSDTPEVVGSTTWGNKNRRMVTWVRFLDRRTQIQFYFVNTHFDHQVQVAREKSAALILERMKALNPAYPVLLAGDFNAVAGQNKVYEMLVGPDRFADTWTLAAERKNENANTFNGFKAITENGARIDWILARGPVKVDRTEIVTFARDGQFPSDHFPVVAWLRLERPAR